MAEEQKTEKTTEVRKHNRDNVVFVGKKPAMSYVLAAITQFSSGMKEIHLKARGRSISTAVDVAEVLKNRFVTDVKREISISTEEITDKDNRKLNVSVIDITLTK
jgi:DNA-binding protein